MVDIKLKVGDKAPDFELNNQDEYKVRLSDYKGQEVVLYFYPKDDTPGCTKESCNFRDNLLKFNDRNMIVLGVSLDDNKSHQSFINKYNLNFPLLSDIDAEVSKKYQVYGKKVIYGKEFMGIKRTTFIIGADGKIKKIFDKVDCENHSEDILKL